MVRWVKRWTENNGKYFTKGILIILSQTLLCSIQHIPTPGEILQKFGGLQMDLKIPQEAGKSIS